MLVTEEVGGTWYVSLGWSIAAQEQIASGKPFDPPASPPVVPAGSATPDDAVRQLVGDLASFDLEKVVADLPPDEEGPLQAYAGELFPGGADPLAKLASQVHVKVLGMQLSDEALSYGELVKVGDLQLQAVVDLGELGTSGLQGTATITLDGSCLTIRIGQVVDHECAGGGAAAQGGSGQAGSGQGAVTGTGSSSATGAGVPGGAGAGDGELRQLEALLPPEVVASLQHLGSSRPDVGLVTVDEDGAWYVSPVATVLHTLDAVLAVVQPSDLQAWASFVRNKAELDHFFTGLLQIGRTTTTLLAEPSA
ncbi:MAG TPA: hypothetical protein VMD59_11265 [Acidimicrobiales bacterium]|nr:hypothetical protein [Acidimicrobiales bacterium]